MNDHILLTILAPPATEETLVDWLLEVESEYGFSSVPVSGHSSGHHGLSLLEQVTGRKQQVRFEIHLPVAETQPLLQKLRADFQGAGLHYWVVPLMEWGHL